MLIFMALLFLTDMVCFSQTGTKLPDSSKINLKSRETGDLKQDKNQPQDQPQARAQAQNKNQGAAQRAANAGAVKQVKSARPDMSKAQGARPNIVRPSGSAVPKGAGKPGGVKKIGGR